MKRKATKQILRILLAVVMLIGLLPVAAPPASASVIGDRETIDNVHITINRPIVGEPLSTCVPETTLCQITCTWNVRGRGLEDFTEIPASTIAKAGETYYLAMILTPKVDLYTFDRSVTGTVNGKPVTVKWISDTMVTCMALLTPKTKADTVDVSVPQPAFGATAGTPTVTNGRAVTTYTWYKTANAATYTMQNSDVFDGYHTYHFTATVRASANEVFTEGTTITVNGKAAGVTVLSRDLEANTITFRYDVTEILNVAPYVGVADGNGGSWRLGLEETQTNGKGYTASYRNGVLTLTNTGDSTISGFYNYNDAYYCGIYAGGDLNIRLEGDFCFKLEGVPKTAAHVYGIYVSGDLNLVNSDADVDRTVSFLPAEGILATTMSSGIHCKEGSLSIQNESQKGFTLNADAVGVRPVDGAVKDNFTNDGIYADGSITIGDHCTVNATAADVQLSGEGETTSRGIYAYSGLTIGENAVVTATGGDINPSRSATTLTIGFSQYCYGVQVRGGDITVNGGALTAKGGDIDYGNLTGPGNATNGRQESYGISAGGITLNGGAITSTAGICRSSALVTGSLSEGISCSNLTVSSGTLEATADDAWLESTGLCVKNNLTQTGGTINGTGDLAVCSGDSTGAGSRGIYIGTLTASGGTLTGTGGTMGNTRPSVGLQAGTIDLSGTARVTGIGGLTTEDTIETTLTGSSTFVKYPGDSIGVWTFHDLTVDGSAVLTATGGTVKGDYTSAAEAMSVGLYIRADAPTISGSGKIVATGGETVYGGKNNKNISDTSRGIYGDGSSLTIDETTVIATGGSVCASTATSLGVGYNYGGISYGIYLPQGALTLQNGAELIATGGANTRYSATSTQPSKYNDSYGAYIKGDITVTDSVLTATGSISHRSVGLLHGGAVTLNGLNSRLTASANEYRTEGYASGNNKYSYGAMNGSDSENWPGGDYTVNDGILLLQGQSSAINYTTKTLTAPAIQCSTNWDGSNAKNMSSPVSLSEFYNNTRRYVKADGSSVIVTIKDWTYGDAASTLTYTKYGGTPSIRWAGTTRAGASYDSNTAPTKAGDYTVTVTYPGGQTGSADFTVHPRSINSCVVTLDDSELTYNGLEQTKGVTVIYNGITQVEGVDYTVTGNKQTNAGTYTMTITGTGNIEGTKTADFTIYQKRPTAEDFNIPEIAEYAYTGEPVELPLPTLKEPYTGGGTITVYYNDVSTQPTEMGEYTVWFEMTKGDNFLNSSSLEYGTLVIRPAGFAVIVNIEDWTYGDTPKTPTYTDYEGEPTILWTGTTRAGKAYSSDTAPTDAGSYTVTVTYPGGQTGSADFTVHPRSISSCAVWLDNSELTYNGLEQIKGVTISYKGITQVEGVDYIVAGNKQTNADTYAMTITGTGNIEGTKTADFTIYRKRPTAEDFNIPEIAEYAYTGERVELPLPTLKESYTGGGTITVYYNLDPTPRRDIGEYEVTFRMGDGTNFYSSSDYLEYGTLVIKAADISDIVLRDLDVPQAGMTPDTDVSSGYLALYSVLDVRWLDDEDNEVNSFEEGKSYTVEITVSSTYIGDGSGNRFHFAESVTASIDGTAVTGEGSSITVNDDDTVTILYKFPAAEAPSTAIHGTVTVTGTASVTVEDFSGTKATLIVAQYSGSGQMMAAQTVSVTANGTFTPDNPFAHANGCTYKAFLVDAKSYVPLCAAAPLSSE